MAVSAFPLDLPAAFSSSTHLSSRSFLYLVPSLQTHSQKSKRALKIKSCLCSGTSQILPARAVYEGSRKQRKPRPSFFDQIRDKWSKKVDYRTVRYPWQVENQQEPEEDESKQSSGVSRITLVSDSDSDDKSLLRNDPTFDLGNRSASAPLTYGGDSSKPYFDSEIEIRSNRRDEGDKADRIWGYSEHNDRDLVVDERSKNPEKEVDKSSRLYNERANIDNDPIKVVKGVSLNDISSSVECSREDKSGSTGLLDVNRVSNFDVASRDYSSGMAGVPWRREKENVLKLEGGDGWKRKSNTKAAESKIPEHELQRLRRVSLRMLERVKVGAAGITQALVDSIHEKWKLDEVVKLKFEGPFAVNMRRVHETLESKTGGLVIWRSGSSIVLYRGMTYKFDCVKQYAKQIQSSKTLGADASWRVGLEHSVGTAESSFPNFARQADISEFDHLLDPLGPRFEDWPGRDPLPIDADLLPCVIPGYQTPFRNLPYGVKHRLRNSQMTYFRRIARKMPPHFALGRNRELQGLAFAMVKLWERSDIAKIAIKRGVQNTLNDRMAEEIKKLTGGTLLSRNKEYIVFYRGNDFLPPVVVEKLIERRKLRDLRQDEEEQARKISTLVDSNAKSSKGLLVAGTLAETRAATSRWGTQVSSADIEEMRKEAALARHASLVRYLEKKLTRAKEKVRWAEKALAKVQKDLEPAELPSDLETITDEERYLFRKLGLSMKPSLLLGRREVFDGIIENMHLHWKYREVVKILVKRKTFAQVKHIAISLEAESGGVLVSLDKTTKGTAIIFYRGKNYQRPRFVRPKNLLTKRQALARSIELQRREQLKQHILNLQDKIELLKSELEDTSSGKEIDEETFYSRMNDAYSSDDDEIVNDEAEDEHLEGPESGSEEDNVRE